MLLQQVVGSDPEPELETPLVEARPDEEAPTLARTAVFRPTSEDLLKYLRMPFLFLRSTVLFRKQFK
jgi:hypothetical protein